jgi:GcrA cell cycle regulator
MTVWKIKGYTESVVRRYKAGEACSAIARSLGLTRNTVTAKLDRLGVLNRREPWAPSARAERTPAPKAPPKTAPPEPTSRYRAPKVERDVYAANAANFGKLPALKLAGNGTVFEDAEARPSRVVIPFRDEPPGCCTLLTLGSGMCKWPIGDTQDPGFTFCGASASEGPYCAGHQARSRQAIPANRPRTGNELARSLRRYL